VSLLPIPIEGDVPMTGDVIYYSQNSDIGDIVNMKDAIIVDQFVILYVGTRKGLFTLYVYFDS
jgi:hypothetical protein